MTTKVLDVGKYWKEVKGELELNENTHYQLQCGGGKSIIIIESLDKPPSTADGFEIEPRGMYPLCTRPGVGVYIRSDGEKSCVVVNEWVFPESQGPARKYKAFISDGALSKGASYVRGGSLIVGEESFPINTPPKSGTMYIHNGQITHDSPAYDISPITRPPSGTSYGSASSSGTNDNGLTASFNDERDRWLWDILDGKADGKELINMDYGPSPRAGSKVSQPPAPYTLTADSYGLLGGDYYISPPAMLGERYESRALLNPILRTFNIGLDRKGTSAPQYYSGTSYICSRHVTDDDNTYTFASFGASEGDSLTINSVSLKKISNSVGVLSYKSHNIYPSIKEWLTPLDKLILIGRKYTGNIILPVFYIDKLTGKYVISDGENTAESLTSYTPGMPEDVDIVLMGDTMRIDKDGVRGPVSKFSGTLIQAAQTLKFNMHEDVTTVERIEGCLN